MRKLTALLIWCHPKLLKKLRAAKLQPWSRIDDHNLMSFFD
jgi:hypothetical protein